MAELCDLTITELARLLRSGAATSRDVVDSALERITAREPAVNGFITVLKDGARRQADELGTVPAGAGPVFGLPLAIKDNICIEGVLTSCGSRILASFVSPYDAFAVRRIRDAQGVIIGKTNMDEFAMGASTETSFRGAARNPWDETRVTGGSSGGSAAVVAYGGAIAALGSDTGGSVRQPAAFCGIVGLKPTYGRVSRYGLVAFASSLDQIGILARNVADAGVMLGVVAGRDERDSTSLDRPVEDYVRDVECQMSGAGVGELRVGLPRECFVEGLDSRVEQAVRRMVKDAEARFGAVREVSLPTLPHAIPAYYLVCMAEASSNLARYDGVRYGLRASGAARLQELYEKTREQGFNDEVKRRILLGTYGLSKGSYEEYYGTGQKVRTLIRRDFEQAFREVDVIVTPTAPTPAYGLGEKLADPLAMYLGDIYTVPVSMAGLPAISIPCRDRADGLPVGLQLIGQAFEERTLLRAARAFEL